MALPALLAAREFRGARGARAVGSHASLAARTALQAELDAHGGCVNHLCWSCDGASLLSSGDDTRLIVWDAARGVKRADVLTGHTANVFCVKPMPGTGDAVVATCAGDSQARLASRGAHVSAAR
jgi:WD40 repeat protein